LWPVAAGALLALVLKGRTDKLPALPEGDIAALLAPARRLALRVGAVLERLDDALRGWTVASVGLVLVAVAVGLALRAA
jgi:hypothetical protein